MNWLIKLLLAVISQCLISILNIIGKLLNNIFNVMYDLQTSLSIGTALTTCRQIGLSLVVVFTLKQLICMYVLENEEIDDDTFSIFTRIAETVATIECGSFAINTLIDIACKLGDLVTDSFTAEDEKRDLLDIMISIIETVVAGSSTVSFILVLFLAVAVITFIIVILKAAKRGAELILFQMVLPFIALSKLGKNREMWISFRNEIYTVCFGYIIQLIGYLGFTKAIALYAQDPLGSNTIKYLLGGMGWLMVTLAAPKWLDKFTSHSGVGNLAKSSLSEVGRLAVGRKIR